MTEVFLDASYAIALSSVTDAHHQKALELVQQLESNRTRLVTTRGVVLEIGNALRADRRGEGLLSQGQLDLQCGASERVGFVVMGCPPEVVFCFWGRRGRAARL